MSTSDKPSESFAALFEAETRGQKHQKPRGPSLGERVKAEVVQVGREAVFVEILGGPPVGKRPQAFLDAPELRDAEGNLTVKVGEVLEAVVVSVDPRSGEIRLGRGMGKPQGLQELETAHAGGIPVEGKVSGVNKGGLEVEVAGTRAFCPFSQIDRGFVADPNELVGRTLQFLVTELKEGGKRIVLSRRLLLEQEAKVLAARTMERVAVGAVLKGQVSAVRDFGAFIDLGGIEGLIPNAELSHDRSQKAEGVLSPGDTVEVQVLEVKEGVVDKKGRTGTKITLSLKALAEDPWDSIETSAQVGKVVRGTVTRLTDFGAFVQLVRGVEGLLHISELGGKITHPSQALSVGETINVVVKSLDVSARKIGLVPAAEGLEVGTQASTPTISVGALGEGTVDRVEPYGVFLQIDGTRGRAGRGLIPNAELGTARGADTRKLFPVGQKLKAKVLETGESKLRLSLKAVKEDEERSQFDGYRAQAESAGKLGTFADLLRKK